MSGCLLSLKAGTPSRRWIILRFSWRRLKGMIFNEEIVFIHNGKAGGTSCSQFLLDHLKRPLYNCHRNAVGDPQLKGRSAGVTPVPHIARHCTLKMALAEIYKLTTRKIEDFQKVFVVIRNPYELEYSYYCHLQKPGVVSRVSKTRPRLVELAKSGFKNFVLHSGYHSLYPQEGFFLVDGIQPPENVELIRFETLETSFPVAVGPYLQTKNPTFFPNLNRSNYEADLNKLLTPDIQQLIIHKHEYMFELGYYEKAYTA